MINTNEVTITGIDSVMKKIEDRSQKYGEALVNAVEAISIELMNDAKAGPHKGNYKDQTGNLRNSIGYELKTGSSAPNGGVESTIYAGMDYAIYVEFKEGYWVLGGAWFFMKHKLLSKLKDYIQRQMQ